MYKHLCALRGAAHVVRVHRVAAGPLQALVLRIGRQAAITLPRYWFDDALAMIDRLVEIAGRIGRTPSQVALQWLLGDSRVTAAIIGARRPEQLAENLAAGDDDLLADIRDELTAAMPLKLGYPHEWTAINLPPALHTAEHAPAHAQRLP